MLLEFMSSVIASMIVEPAAADLREALAGAQAAPAIVEQAETCLREGAPRLLTQAGERPAWALTSAMGVTIGWYQPDDFLQGIHPACDATLAQLQKDET
ncbi:hypothetical protein LJR098_003958 [Rhizobium sp. LjRoot98]|uniref:hypothetical protein n=1 Tax=unclassified Rhizobium TaxID=2613769 RepID=UPI0007146AA3|nr:MULTISPECIES: hypothetical protein [unclassified Rhizobium]KQV39700.1 hypothetical protein ASC96_22575 [Rhizobium sp. Root1204]KQY01962.1 hypothetical protein ASD36_17735 [Rhizobium sp. Root1334]